MPEVGLQALDLPGWQRSLPMWWDEPWFDGRLLQAHAQGTGQELVLLAARGAGWRGWYPLLLSHGRLSGAVLARTPPFGGPLLEAEHDDPGQNPNWLAGAAVEFRGAIEHYLDDLGVASEIYLLPDWLPGAFLFRQAWPVQLLHRVAVSHAYPEGAALRSRKLRSDLSRASQVLRTSWRPFQEADQAIAFAARIADALQAIGAPESAQPPAGYFTALAELAPQLLWESTADGPDGGCVQLFAQRGGGAQFLFSGRWGNAAGSSSLGLWLAERRLSEQSVRRLCLGGGTTQDPDDSLLAFKGKHADLICQLAVGSRVYRPRLHEAAVLAGEARPLPGTRA